MAHQFFHRLTCFIPLNLLETHDHLGLQFDLARLVGARNFGDVGEHRTFAQCTDFFARHVIQTQHDVLRRDDDRLAVCRRQHVVGSQHQRAAFHLRFQRQWHVHRHLVTVEVGVECRAHQRMQLDRLAFDQDRLESLDTQTVQRRRAVQHHRMLAYHLFEDVPHDRALPIPPCACCALMVVARPIASRRLKMNGLNNSSAIFLGRPH